ncbi:MAG: transcriptional regulator, partial [Nitrososphaerales archaeon]
IFPDEVSVRAVAPALRAVVAKELFEEHELTQSEIGSLLSVSQAAVSYYLRDMRGTGAEYALKNEEVRKITSNIVKNLASGTHDQKDIIALFSKAMQYIKGNRLLCGVHKKFEPDLDLSLCHICDAPVMKIET